MRAIKILHLYPDRMNIYGDFGNIITLQKRMEWRGIKSTYHPVSIGDDLKGDYDIIFMGGGQDRGQQLVAKDLLLKSDIIHDHARRGTPILAICGAYQLFGKYFVTSEGERLPGIGLFDLVTRASDQRMIGNLVVQNDVFGEMVGFENHSGETELLDGSLALGKVLKGFGNTSQSIGEGIIQGNSIGTYMHGSFLPKNPKVADFLIEKAVHKIEPNFVLKNLDDSLENKTLQSIINLTN